MQGAARRDGRPPVGSRGGVSIGEGEGRGSEGGADEGAAGAGGRAGAPKDRLGGSVRPDHAAEAGGDSDQVKGGRWRWRRRVYIRFHMILDRGEGGNLKWYSVL